MKRTTNLIAWLAAGVVALLAALNWGTLMAPAPLNLLVAEVQAPVGVVMLALAGVLVGLFFVASLRNQIASLLETRRLLKEIQRVQELADKAEASRIEKLQRSITEEFRRLDERLSLSERIQLERSGAYLDDASRGGETLLSAAEIERKAHQARLAN